MFRNIILINYNTSQCNIKYRFTLPIKTKKYNIHISTWLYVNIRKLIRYVLNPYTITSPLHRYILYMVHIKLGTPNFSLVNKKKKLCWYIVCLLNRDRKVKCHNISYYYSIIKYVVDIFGWPTYLYSIIYLLLCHFSTDFHIPKVYEQLLRYTYIIVMFNLIWFCF